MLFWAEVTFTSSRKKKTVVTKNSNEFESDVLYYVVCPQYQTRPFHTTVTALIVSYVTPSSIQCLLQAESRMLTMYMCSSVVFAILAPCFCYTGYDLFKGFDVNDGDRNATTLTTETAVNLTTPIDRSTVTPTSVTKFKCPEEERPISIGPYEVPTQRDLVYMTKTMLTNLFNSYYQEALLLINDIKEATKASVVVEKKCPKVNRAEYKQCVKRVKSQSELTVKNLIAALENQKIDVAALTEDKICNLGSMKTDPLELIKILSQENASLQFALPGFLRLLSSCSFFCSQSHSKEHLKKSPDLFTDLELVVKHFLNPKNSNKLL